MEATKLPLDKLALRGELLHRGRLDLHFRGRFLGIASLASPDATPIKA
jgi:hypothetical protein